MKDGLKEDAKWDHYYVLNKDDVQGLQVTEATNSDDDESVTVDDDQDVVNGDKYSIETLFEMVKKSAMKHEKKDVLVFVEEQVRGFHDRIPDDPNWKPSLELYGYQPSGKLVFQPSRHALAMKFGDELMMSILVSNPTRSARNGFVPVRGLRPVEFGQRASVNRMNDPACGP